MISAEIDLMIPDFLRVDRAEAVRRLQWNETHPIVQTGFSGQSEESRRDVDEARERMKVEQKERARQQLEALAERKREEAQAKVPHQFSKRLPGMIWNTRYGKWVLPNFMSQRKYDRLLSEMPTEAHRAAFIKTFGSGHGASRGAGGSPACATKDASMAGSTPAGAQAKTRSAVKGAGRVRVPSEPRARVSGWELTAPTTKPPRAPSAAGAWKAGVISMLERPEGATLAEIGAVYGWQEHSVSARLSAIRKERVIIATVEERGSIKAVRVYRMEKAS